MKKIPGISNGFSFPPLEINRYILRLPGCRPHLVPRNFLPTTHVPVFSTPQTIYWVLIFCYDGRWFSWSFNFASFLWFSSQNLMCITYLNEHNNFVHYIGGNLIWNYILELGIGWGRRSFSNFPKSKYDIINTIDIMIW